MTTQKTRTRIAYYIPGLGWKQRWFDSEEALERFLTEREGDIAEVRYLVDPKRG